MTAREFAKRCKFPVLQYRSGGDAENIAIYNDKNDEWISELLELPGVQECPGQWRWDSEDGDGPESPYGGQIITMFVFDDEESWNEAVDNE